MRVLRKKERNKGLKNWKAKLSMLMVLCLVLTGSHGLVLSADAQEEQGGSPNRIESRGDNVKLHFKGEDLRQAAEAAIYEGVKFSITESLSYSKDPELLQLYRDSLAEGKELYEISLDNFVNGTEAVYQETGAKVRAIVEIDPTERTGEIEKQGKDALGFFAKDSSFGKLMEQGNPDWYEEALAPEREKERLALEKSEADKVKEEKAAQSQGENAEPAKETSEATQEASSESAGQEMTEEEKNAAAKPDFINSDSSNKEYKVQGTELIHFLYENHGEQDLRFQLFVDSNSYPSVKVQSKTKLAKSILEDLKNLEDKIKKSNAKKDGEEQEVKQNTEALPSTAQSNESLASSEESQSSELTTASEAGQSSETSTATEESQSTETSASVEESQEQSTVVITEVKAEGENKKEKAKNSQEDPVLALYQEMKADITPFLSELYTAKYQIYSLNELGRRSQHKEVEDFGVVEVFYDKEAFSENVTLQVSKMVKPEEAKSDEPKLSDAQVEALKVRGYYEDSRSIDIHFVNAEGVEVEPTLPVAVRLSISKDILPEEAKPENISIHHLVEEEGSDKIAYVETVSDTEKNAKNVVEENAKITEELTKKEETGEETKPEEKEKKEIQPEEKNDKAEKNAYIVREFNVKSFSVYTLTWSSGNSAGNIYEFYFVDGDFREVGPNISVDMSQFTNTNEQPLYTSIRYPYNVYGEETHYIYQDLPGYVRHDRVYYGDLPLSQMGTQYNRDNGISWGYEVYLMTTKQVIPKPYFEDFINNQGYWQTWDAFKDATSWENTGTKNGRTPCKKYYYFFYKLDTKTHTHTYPSKDPEVKQEKYITKKADGSYDITLTARPIINESEKNKLDVIVVYDKSMYMGFPYNEVVKKDHTRPAYNKVDRNGGVGTRHYYGKQFVSNLVEKLSKNPIYDTQFALVTMGGTRSVSYDTSGGTFNKVTALSDTPYNDAEKVIGFTKDASLFKQKVNEITLEGTSGNGLNYAAGIKEAINFQNGATVGANTQSIRSDARRVVLFITSYEPNFSYFPKYNADGNHPLYFLQPTEKTQADGKIALGNVPGNVIDYANIGGPNTGLSAGRYKFTAKYEAGYSYGSGRGFEQVAFTQARAELTGLYNIDDFYTFGLGPNVNYNSLGLLTGKSYVWMRNDLYIEPGDHHPKEQPLDSSIEQKFFPVTVPGPTSNPQGEPEAEKVKERIDNLTEEVRKLLNPVYISHIKIKDRLSENVEINFNPNNPTEKAAKLRWEIWKLNSQGKATEKIDNPDSLSDFAGYGGFTVNYDSNQRSVEMYNSAQNTFSFPFGYEYHLIVNVKPTIKAYEKYQKNFMDYFDKESERLRISQGKDIGYLDNVDGDNLTASSKPLDTYSIKEGDLRTDQWYLFQKTPEEQFHTSSQKEGFYSNEGAYLRYRLHKEKNKTFEIDNKYQKPVVQIEPATLRIVKSFVGTNSSSEELELLKNTSFILKEQIPGSTNYREVKRFSMTKSATSTALGYLVSEELNGGGKKQYVLSINGLIPGRKYQVEEAISASGQNPVIGGSQLHFKKMAITAGVDRDSKATSGNYEIATVSMGKNETKEINVQNTYEREDRQILRIEKQVSGEMADKNQVFPFRLKLFKAANQPITQSDFDSIKADFPAATKSAISFDAGTATISFNLKHDQALEFLLPKTYYYMAGENPSGYLPSVSTGYVLEQATDAQGFRFTKKKLLGRNADGSKQVLQFRNVKDPISPTGVVDEAKPLAMVFTAFILFSGAIAFGMKKKEEF
jgi:hypothetical protein